MKIHDAIPAGLILILTATSATAQASSRVTHAIAIPEDESGAAARHDASLLEAARQNPTLDPSRYLPMPLPRVRTAVRDDSPSGDVVSYDVATQRVTRRQERRLRATGPKLRRGSSGPGPVPSESGISPMNFGQLAKLAASSAFPWRMNVKVFISFGSKNYVASGVMIDPMHVLTAGHVVHNKSLGGWATRITVAPAYNGDATGDAKMPFGSARSVQLHSWTGWTQSQSWAHDLGVIDLDRPIGALTGWFGFGYNSNCNYFTSPSWHHASYPAASPYSGRRMFYQSGKFDFCLTTARYNRRGYGGESGSGFYKFVGNDRHVFAITSSGTSSWTQAARLTKSKFGHVGEMLDEDRPSTFDLTPLAVSAPSSVSRNGPLTQLSFIVHNYSKRTFQGRIRFSIRLSLNSTISTADQKLGDYYVERTIPPLGSLRVKWATGGPPVPRTQPLGDYYVGVILKTYDANARNQFTLPNDVHKIRVWERGDFAPYGIGCNGTRGRPIHTAVNTYGRPVIGTTTRYTVGPVRPWSFAGLTLGFSNRQWGPIRLPLELSAFGSPGCRLYTDVATRLWVWTGNGAASVSLPHPNSKDLIGLRFNTQFIVRDPGANRSGYVYSNALRSVLGTVH